jgi:hypothetical protein
MEVIFVLTLILFAFAVMGTIMGILVALHLSRQLDDQYDDLRETEETFRAMVSEVYRYVEAVDDSATGGAGNKLYLQRRVRDKAVRPRQPVKH